MDRKVRWGILGCAGIAEKAFIPAVLGSRNGALGRDRRPGRKPGQGLGRALRLRPRPPDLSGARRGPGRRRDLQPPAERPPRRMVHPGHAGRQARPLRKAHGPRRPRGPGHDPGGRERTASCSRKASCTSSTRRSTRAWSSSAGAGSARSGPSTPPSPSASSATAPTTAGPRPWAAGPSTTSAATRSASPGSSSAPSPFRPSPGPGSIPRPAST